MPLEEARLITSRMLPLSLMKHVPDIVRARTISIMERQDEKRALKEATKRDELLSLARDEECQVLKLEARKRWDSTPSIRYAAMSLFNPNSTSHGRNASIFGATW